MKQLTAMTTSWMPFARWPLARIHLRSWVPTRLFEWRLGNQIRRGRRLVYSFQILHSREIYYAAAGQRQALLANKFDGGNGHRQATG